MFGKNMMGSYASQLSYKDRWLVLEFVQQMQDDFSSGTAETVAPAADSTSTL
jgi:hypothetical protein